MDILIAQQIYASKLIPVLPIDVYISPVLTIYIPHSTLDITIVAPSVPNQSSQ